jgi:gas vesicle protein GvpG
MFLIDDLLIGGLGFVFDKIARVVDEQLNDESGLHRTLMEAQLQLEMGEIDDEQFATIEADVIERLRELREARDGETTAALTDEDVRITGVEISGPDDLER